MRVRGGDDALAIRLACVLHGSDTTIEISSTVGHFTFQAREHDL